MTAPVVGHYHYGHLCRVVGCTAPDLVLSEGIPEPRPLNAAGRVRAYLDARDIDAGTIDEIDGHPLTLVDLEAVLQINEILARTIETITKPHGPKRPGR